METEINKETKNKKLNDKIMNFATRQTKVTETTVGKNLPPRKVTATLKKG